LQDKAFSGRLYVYLKALSIADLGFLTFAGSYLVGPFLVFFFPVKKLRT
jgi:hypothetical protein